MTRSGWQECQRTRERGRARSRSLLSGSPSDHHLSPFSAPRRQIRTWRLCCRPLSPRFRRLRFTRTFERRESASSLSGSDKTRLTLRRTRLYWKEGGDQPATTRSVGFPRRAHWPHMSIELSSGGARNVTSVLQTAPEVTSDGGRILGEEKVVRTATTRSREIRALSAPIPVGAPFTRLLLSVVIGKVSSKGHCFRKARSHTVEMDRLSSRSEERNVGNVPDILLC